MTQPVLGRSQRDFLLRHYAGKLSQHNFEEKILEPNENMTQMMCKRCKRSLFVTLTGQVAGSAYKDICTPTSKEPEEYELSEN